MTPILELKGLGKCFDGRWIFRHVDLSVQRGESVVLLGPSGSGKSLLLRIACALTSADEGEVTPTFGQNDGHSSSGGFGMLFQKNALFDSLTVLENLLFPLRERIGITGARANEIAEEALRSVGLQGTGLLRPDELSGGMQKRLGLARALIVNPELLLCDEPTAGLDPVTARSIGDLINASRGSRAWLTVTHDRSRAFQIADRIFFLAQGELIHAGTPEETRRSKDPRIVQFIRGDREGPLSRAVNSELSELGDPGQ